MKNKWLEQVESRKGRIHEGRRVVEFNEKGYMCNLDFLFEKIPWKRAITGWYRYTFVFVEEQTPVRLGDDAQYWGLMVIDQYGWKNLDGQFGLEACLRITTQSRLIRHHFKSSVEYTLTNQPELVEEEQK